MFQQALSLLCSGQNRKKSKYTLQLLLFHWGRRHPGITYDLPIRREQLWEVQPRQDQWGGESNSPTSLVSDSGQYSPPLPRKNQGLPFLGRKKAQTRRSGNDVIITVPNIRRQGQLLLPCRTSLLKQNEYKRKGCLCPGRCACAHAFSPVFVGNKTSTVTGLVTQRGQTQVSDYTH